MKVERKESQRKDVITVVYGRGRGRGGVAATFLTKERCHHSVEIIFLYCLIPNDQHALFGQNPHFSWQMSQKEVVEKVSLALKEAGFVLGYEDTDMSHLESYSRPEYLDQVWVVGKSAEKNYAFASSFTPSSYVNWRKNSFLRSTHLTEMQYKKSDFKPDSSLDEVLESLCQHSYFKLWNSEQEILLLLQALLLLKSLKSVEVVETLKLHLDKNEEIGELVCYYIIKGRVDKVATLLTFAWQSLTTGNSSDSKCGSSCGSSKICQFVISETEKLIEKEVQQLGNVDINKFRAISMDKNLFKFSSLNSALR